jgi:hypothetical protein
MRRHSLEVEPDTFLAHYFKRIDPAVAESFTPRQRQAMVRMFATRWSEKHPVNVRKSLGIGRRRFYIVFLAGREKRPMSRLRREGALNRDSPDGSSQSPTMIAQWASDRESGPEPSR